MTNLGMEKIHFKIPQWILVIIEQIKICYKESISADVRRIRNT